MPQRAVIYTRISRDDSGEGVALDRQEAACRALATLRGWEVVHVEKRDVSRSAYKESAKRPGWDHVVELMRSGQCDVVIAWKLDRVTRRVKGLLRIIELAEETGVVFATTDGLLDLSTPTGKAVATILGAVAQMEVELKAERQKSANQQRAAKGQAWGSGWRPFGFTRGEMAHVPEEAEMIRKAASDVLAGASLKSIAREWRESGVTTPRSKKGAAGWTHNGVRSILLNPRNAGLNTYRGEVVGPGAWDPIFSEEAHHQLTAMLTDPKRLLRMTGSNGRTPSNLLSGIARCGTCGAHVHAGTSNGKRVYKCSGPGEHITTSRDSADSIVINSLTMAAITMRPGVILDLPEAGDAEGVTAALRSLTKRQADIAAAYAEGSLPLEAWQRANEAMNAERLTLEQALSSADGMFGHNAEALHAQSVANFEALDLNGKRDVLRARVEVTLHPRNRRRNVPMKQQVSVFLRTVDDGWRDQVVPVLAEHPEAQAAMKAGKSIWSGPVPPEPPAVLAKQQTGRREPGVM